MPGFDRWLVLICTSMAALSLAPACDEEPTICRAGEQYCPGVGCVNTANSAENCGVCGNACPGCYRCTRGECDPQCCAEQFNCGTRYELDCVNLYTSREHCGRCQNLCAEDQICQRGECTFCSPPSKVCGNTCADVSSDIHHCGECDNPCIDGWCHCGECYEGDRPPDGGCGDGDADLDAGSDVDAASS